jgi:hypothetical protein
MSRNDQIVPVGRHRVKHSLVWRVRDADRKINLVTINRSGHIGVTILIKMGVVGSTQADPDTLDL